MDEKSGNGKIQFFALEFTFLIVGLIGVLIMTAATLTGRTYSWMTINVFIYALGAALLFFLEDKNDGVGMLTILMVAAVQALRCVVLPVMETLTDNFAEYSYIYTFNEACRLTVWEQAVIDIGRDIFGIHFLFGGMPTTVNYYNLLIYNGAKDTGWLFSSIGYGICIWAVSLRPFSRSSILSPAVLFERLLYRTVNVEPIYIVGYAYTRIIFNVFGSFPGTLNNVSQYMTLAGLVLLAAWFAKRTVAGRKARRLTGQGCRKAAMIADRRK